jgi:hypothetical protein
MMGLMRARFIVVALVVARTASAQAPGEVQPIAPPPAPIVCADCLSVMEHRWSVSLSLAATGLQSKDNTDQVNLGGGEVAVAFRATPHLELQLQLADAHENHEDIDSHMELGSVAFAFRYHFLPFQHWDVYAHAALGSATLTQDAQPKSDARAMFQLGFGVEYRFVHLAIHIELRGLAIGSLMTVPLTDPAGDGGIRLAGQLSGGQGVLGASYYF